MATTTPLGDPTTGHREPGAGNGDGRASGGRLALAHGLELIGEYDGSGFREPPHIVRRADGQTIQLTPLLYAVAEASEPPATAGEVAERAGRKLGRELGAGDVEYLAERKLRPLGVLARADGSSPRLDKPDPLLALKFKTKVVPAAFTRACTTLFRPLFLPPVVAVVVAAFAALIGWLLFVHGIAQPARDAIYQPSLLLLVLGGMIVATAFHEIGHATACRYGGAEPGVMGVGIYVVWPAFYTDVTDAYRLDRTGRLRTDLGGIYFNMIFALAAGGAYFLTSFEPVLLLVLLQLFAILQQLLPFLRLDGYYVLADATGVPDIFGRIKPILRSLRPGADPEPRVEELKPWVRVVVTGYICVLIPVLVGAFTIMLLHVPRLAATAYDSLGQRFDTIDRGWAEGALGTVVAAGLQSLFLVLPLCGVVLTTWRVGGRISSGAWRWSAERPVARTLLVAGASATVAVAAFTWWPNGEYRPLQESERGRVQDAARAVTAIPSGRPALTPERSEQLDREAAGVAEQRQADAPVAEEPTATTPTTTTTAVEPAATTPAPTAAPAPEPVPTTTAPATGGGSVQTPSPDSGTTTTDDSTQGTTTAPQETTTTP